MDKIKITVNGVEIETSPDNTILDAVIESGLDTIPTLCHDKRLEHFTSCFLCVVEAEGINKLLPSCSVKVSPGMKISTNSPRVIETRKTALELLMSNHYADCIGPCRSNCPAGVDAQAYIALISMGKYMEALKLVKENNPLPLSIGRVCVRDCEAACRRNYVDEPVAVNALKRFIADLDNVDKWVPEIKEDNGKKIAVIGSGPAGLSCAYYLRLEGYGVKIFEKLPELGGMLRYGIPEYRLPKKVLDAEISWILNLGVEAETGVEIGKDSGIKDLLRKGFDAVFIGVGAHKASTLGMDGEEKIKGIFRGIDFLREAGMGNAPRLSGTVIVVGGGNTAMDAARTALRCGADVVKIVYRRSINEMPARHEEIEAAVNEGVELNLLTNPKSIIHKKGVLKGIECLKMMLVEGKPGERPKPVPVEGSEFQMECDYLIGAIGQAVDTHFSFYDEDCILTKAGTLTINNSTMETSVKGVFAGGDAVTGPLTAITAIAQGKKAAHAIMEYIQKGSALAANGRFYSMKQKLAGISEREYEHIPKTARVKLPELNAEERVHNFQEVEKGISESQCINETMRCLECGCSEYYDCRLRQLCDEYKIDINDYLGETRKYEVDNRHPFISLDPNKCIGCGRCVRTCTEILKVSALGFVYRGFKSVVKPAMEKPLTETNCISCGNCIDACPTGAISAKQLIKIPGTLPKQNVKTICSFCSAGCSVNYKKTDNDIYYISNTTDEVINSDNKGWLCVKGRFGSRYLQGGKRIVMPLIREKGRYNAAACDDALKYTVQRIKEIQKQYGKDSVAVFASPRLSNEEIYLLQKFTRTGLKNNNISSFTNLVPGIEQNSLDEMLGLTASTISADELNNTDLIIVINSNLSEENPAMELKIKEAMKHGASLVLFNSSEIRLARNADLWIDSRKGTNALLLNSIIKYLIDNKLIDFDFLKGISSDISIVSTQFDEYDLNETLDYSGVDPQKINLLLKMISDRNKKIVFVYNIESLADRSVNDLKAIGSFLLLTGRQGQKGNGIILLREFSNSAGLMEMGAHPDYLPGFIRLGETEEIASLERLWKQNLIKVFRPSDIAGKMKRGLIKALLIFGEDPMLWKENMKYLDNADFILAADAFRSALSEDADVVLPLAMRIETEGSYIRYDNHIQYSDKVIDNPFGIENWEIISLLASEFAPGFKYNSVKEISEEIKQADRLLRIPGEEELRIQKFIAGQLRQRKAHFSKYACSMAVYDPVKPTLHYQDNYYLCSIRSKLV